MKTRINRVLYMVIAVVVLFPTILCAQDKATAVLEHDGTTQVFYGVDALRSALNGAVAGDFISLSPGVFNSATITKAVKIQGSGVQTHINGNMSVKMDSDQKGLVLEGLKFLNNLRIEASLTNATIQRCVIVGQWYVNSRTNLTDVNIIQCKLEISGTYGSNYFGGGKLKNIYAGNCIIKGCVHEIPLTSEVVFENCVLGEIDNTVNGGIIKNCIVMAHGTNSNGMTYLNSILPSDDKLPPSDAVVKNVEYIPKNQISSLFKDSKDYYLTDEAASAYSGTDGKQLGIYGGVNPFTLIPSIPVIKSAQIDSKVNEDGKLNVVISVENN